MLRKNNDKNNSKEEVSLRKSSKILPINSYERTDNNNSENFSSRKRETKNRRKIVNRENIIAQNEENTSVYRQRCDITALFAIILLVLFGIVMVFSSSYYTTSYSAEYNYDMFYFLKRHSFMALIGLASMIFFITIDYRILKRYAYILYWIAVVFLILVLIIGVEKNGAKRWLVLGPINFQPSEIAKLGLIFALSRFISDHIKLTNYSTNLFIACFLIMLPIVVLIGIQNLSTCIIVVLIGASLIFVVSRKIWGYLVLGLVGCGILAFILSFGFRASRVEVWRDPFSDPSGVGYQTIQSLYAIASGGFFGLGLGQSRQKLGFIPEAHNDIIFAIVCEELGLFGALILMLLFAILIWRGLKIAMNAVDYFGSLVATGITVMIAVQVILNVAVVTNTIPNTGVPLPFISYGGTSLVIMMSAMGVLLNISKHYKK